MIGSVDLATVGDLREKLSAAVERAVADEMPVLSLDLSATELIDAAGLGVLLGAHRRARRAGTRLKLVRLTPELSRVLLVSRLYRVLDVETGEAASTAPSGSSDTAVAAPADVLPEQRDAASDRRHLASS